MSFETMYSSSCRLSPTNDKASIENVLLLLFCYDKSIRLVDFVISQAHWLVLYITFSFLKFSCFQINLENS